MGIYVGHPHKQLLLVVLTDRRQVTVLQGQQPLVSPGRADRAHHLIPTTSAPGGEYSTGIDLLNENAARATSISCSGILNS